MRPRLVLSCCAAVAFLACLPTAPCACPPTTSLFVLYGSMLDGRGAPVAGAVVRASLAQDEACVFDDAEDVEGYPERPGDAGSFRTQLRSMYGATRTRCMRLFALRNVAEEPDSSSVLELIVRFRMDREPSDSLGVVFRFR